MRKNLLLILGFVAVTSCGVSSSSVRGTVAIEKNCPKENVRILEKVKTMGRGLYSVEACGEVYTYNAWGNMIFEDE